MSLLDVDYRYYFVEKPNSKLNDSKILDENGNLVGIIKIDKDSNEIQIQEIDGKIVFVITRSRIFSKYKVKNENGDLEANFKSKKANKIILNIMTSNQNLEAYGGPTCTFVILEHGKSIAQTSRFDESFLKPKFEFDKSKFYILEILEQGNSRKFILAFFIFLLDFITEKWFGLRDYSAYT